MNETLMQAAVEALAFIRTLRDSRPDEAVDLLTNSGAENVETALENALASVTAEHDAEPVAYAVFTDDGLIRMWSKDAAASYARGDMVPLFRASPATGGRTAS